MDITKETKKLESNPILRYALLCIGILTILFSQGILTWKSAAERDARGKVKSIELKIGKLEKEIADSEDTDEKKDLREDIKKLKEENMVDARMNQAQQTADANSHIWLVSMIRHLGLALAAIGLLVISAAGSSHEKIGALIALGLLIART